MPRFTTVLRTEKGSLRPVALPFDPKQEFGRARAAVLQSPARVVRWITDAKRDATRAARVRRAVELLPAGVRTPDERQT